MLASGAQRAVARFRTRINANPSLDRHSGVRKAPGHPPGTPPLIGEVYMTAVSRRSFLLAGGTAAAAGAVLTGAGVTLLSPAARAATAAKSAAGLAGAGPAGVIYVAAGQTYTVPATTRVSAVTIEAGSVLAAPAGH